MSLIQEHNLDPKVQKKLNTGGFQMSSYATLPDAKGLYTQVEYKRQDDTLFLKSVLSGGTTPLYTTITLTFYQEDGTTVDKSGTCTLTYDSDNKIINKVFSDELSFDIERVMVDHGIGIASASGSTDDIAANYPVLLLTRLHNLNKYPKIRTFITEYPVASAAVEVTPYGGGSTYGGGAPFIVVFTNLNTFQLKGIDKYNTMGTPTVTEIVPNEKYTITFSGSSQGVMLLME